MTSPQTYQSPFSWRYGSHAMRQIWSEDHKRRMWRQIWVALASVQAQYGLVLPEQVSELEAHAGEINLERALEIEAEIHHDLMAELKTFAEQCPNAGGILHLGATSMDIEDNAECMRIRASLDLILSGLRGMLEQIAIQVERWADLPVIAFTHLQPAEPTTLGYRLAFTAQDLLDDWLDLVSLRMRLRGKGFKGAVGTSAAFSHLIPPDRLDEFEGRLSQLLDLPFFPVTHQTVPRRQEYQLISSLAGMAASLHKFAFDLRFLQSPVVGELSEPFGQSQVGSSAMPFKRNPITAEKIDSLARSLAQLPRQAWDNMAFSLLERTLDDSANRRTLLPESFLISDELLGAATKIISGLRVNEQTAAKNLENYAAFAATERILLELVQVGADRQEMHEKLRQLSLAAWAAIQRGESNPLPGLIQKDDTISRYLPAASLEGTFDVRSHVGQAPIRARELAGRIRDALQSTANSPLTRMEDQPIG